MAERVARKVDVRRELVVLPPWPLEDHLEDIAHAENPFRREHVPPGRFVLMYSGNHSPVNPLGTILDAVESLQGDPRLLLFCVGGGEGKREVEERIQRGVRNIRSFPYQPLDRLRFSLSAADAHVVSLGDELVGIVHPCKVYGAMAVSRPVLVVGPAPSHVSELLDRLKIGWRVPHGDVGRAVTTIKEMMDAPAAERMAMGRRGREALAEDLGRTSLLLRLCDVLQRGLPSPA
jgi:glycosyltransferase involved in cell wall biosynthesis